MNRKRIVIGLAALLVVVGIAALGQTLAGNGGHWHKGDFLNRRIAHLSREEAEGNYDVHMRNGGYTCAITEEGIRYQGEVLALAKGVDKKVTLQDAADLSFLEKAQGEVGKAG